MVGLSGINESTPPGSEATTRGQYETTYSNESVMVPDPFIMVVAMALTFVSFELAGCLNGAGYPTI
uniref:Uncharacterized protein n=1 Tax=Aspergillus fumigatus TaxID=746128 RepID=Q6MYS8_ASPFM|nr:hypothetical protein AfA28D1.085 [Aspergillus fumigatus]